MRLISVKILGNSFRSLVANRLYEFNPTSRPERLSTKVFAGLNGSGKSNFLELFSEIFYYLEIYHLSTVSRKEKLGNNIGFEIEYWLPADENKIAELFQDEISDALKVYILNNRPLTKYSEQEFVNVYRQELDDLSLKENKNFYATYLSNKYLYVRITKPIGEHPSFSLKKTDGSLGSFEIYDRTAMLLPKRVIAYTSGQNELVSNPYHKIKYHYFKEFTDSKAAIGREIAEESRLFYLDYNNNFSIFIANMLLAEPLKLSYLNDFLNIKGLTSFRITINLVDIYKERIPISEKLRRDINKLKNCATSWFRSEGIKEDLLVLDFVVTEDTKKAFNFHFDTAFNLFKLFYELEILNLHLIKKDSRSLMLRVHKQFNFSDELPKSDPSKLVFRLEQIIIKKNIIGGDVKRFFYKGLSDGEHQFNEVIGTALMMEEEGCLFLMDEPDTHFNPTWRAKMIEMLNFVTAKSVIAKERFRLDSTGNPFKDIYGNSIKETYHVPQEVRRQEFIVTTHSPFIISDSQREDVYKFDNTNGEVTYVNPKIETYGASIGLLMQEIFDRKISITDLSNFDMNEWRQAFMTLLSSGDLETKATEIMRKINEAKTQLIEFGESIEKFDLFAFIAQVEKELNQLK